MTTKHPATSTVFTPTTKPGNGSVSSDGSNFNDQNIGPPSPPQNNKGLLKRMLYVVRKLYHYVQELTVLYTPSDDLTWVCLR